MWLLSSVLVQLGQRQHLYGGSRQGPRIQAKALSRIVLANDNLWLHLSNSTK